MTCPLRPAALCAAGAGVGRPRSGCAAGPAGGRALGPRQMQRSGCCRKVGTYFAGQASSSESMEIPYAHEGGAGQYLRTVGLTACVPLEPDIVLPGLASLFEKCCRHSFLAQVASALDGSKDSDVDATSRPTSLQALLRNIFSSMKRDAQGLHAVQSGSACGLKTTS